MLAAFLAGCAGASPTAGPGAVPAQATAVPLQPTATTEARQTPQRTFVIVDTPVPAETVIEVEVMKTTPQNSYIANLVQQAQQDLAKQLAVPVEQIEFVSFEDVLWPDGSLGCPQPGMAYTQVLVEGYRILLQYEGQTYAYHGGGNRPPFLCKNPQQ
jgi:hypothetical protein